MSNKSINPGYSTTASQSRWLDYMILIKFRLTSLVVLSAILAYLISAGNLFSLSSLIILGLGGFCITSAANALNQALEKDFDILMRRTADRPVAAGRMSLNEAILSAGLLFVFGIILLSWFNPICAVLGALAVVSYAFLYTPLKRTTPLSVFVGAIPGALPTMIAVTAFEGTVTPMAIALFGLQFFWQFPHFWSIGYLGFEDYKRAGFRLVPEQGGKVHPDLGLQSAVFALLLLPCAIAPFYLGEASLTSCILVVILSLVYAGFGWKLQRQKSQKSARQLMFASFLYLPLVLFIFYWGSF